MKPLVCVAKVVKYESGYYFALLTTKQGNVVMASDGHYECSAQARERCYEWIRDGKAERMVEA